MTVRKQNVAAWCLVAGFGLLALGGCQPPQVSPAGQAGRSPVIFTKNVVVPNGIVSDTTQSLTPAEVQAVMQGQGDDAYTLGPNDVVSISLYMHPELSVPAPNSAPGMLGALVTGDGTITMPLIGTIKIGGMTLDQAQLALQDAFRTYVKAPSINLQLVLPQSLRYYLLGSFTSPGIKYPVRELTLLEALSLGGSVDISHADLYQAYVSNGQMKLPVDLNALLVEGDMSQNIVLASGDTIVVPSAAAENAFVFGAVSKPGAVSFQSGELTLLQAISSAGLDLPTYTDAELSQVRVIRPHGSSADFFVVDASQILSGAAGPFVLRPGDIVFVPPTAIATWNQAIDQILPSLQTVGAALSPFVSIKYLTNH